MTRRTLSIAIIIIIFSHSFVKCKKAETNNPPAKDAILTGPAAQVDAWLGGELQRADSSGKARIGSLRSNLLHDQLYTETYGRGQRFFVVPISENFVSLNNAEKKPVNVLLLFVTDTGIRKANVVQLLSERSAAIAPRGMFTDIFNSRVPAFSGTLSFLSITDSRQYDITYKKGSLFSHSEIRSKKNTATNGRTAGCTAFYFVTYYSDGSEDWEYFYTSCIDDCEQTRVAGNISFRVDCNGGGGGSSSGAGGAGNSTEECCLPDGNVGVNSESVAESVSELTLDEGLTTKTKVYEWTFLRSSLLWYHWSRNSIETGTLDNASGEWRFASLVHTSDRLQGTTPPCVNVQFKMDATNATYSENRKQATMELYFSESISLGCLPFKGESGTSSQPDSRSKMFYAE